MNVKASIASKLLIILACTIFGCSPRPELSVYYNGAFVECYRNPGTEKYASCAIASEINDTITIDKTLYKKIANNIAKRAKSTEGHKIPFCCVCLDDSAICILPDTRYSPADKQINMFLMVISGFANRYKDWIEFSKECRQTKKRNNLPELKFDYDSTKPIPQYEKVLILPKK